jgi:sugar/nucleoside kinase (ribokinase family)
MQYDVVCVGTLNVDLIVIGDAPRELPELLTWVAPSEVELFAAGSVGYCAIDLARLGLKVSLLSSVADDALGKLMLSELAAAGIDVECVTVHRGEQSGMGIYLLLFGSRKRPLTGRMSTHAPWPAELSAAAEARLKSARLLHCGGYLHYPRMWGEPTERLYRRAKEYGLITSLDSQFPFAPVEGRWLPLFGRLLHDVDLLFTDETEAAAITGADTPAAAARALLGEGPRLVAIKLGARGALLATKDELIQQPPFPAATVTDSIGAGDAFDAGLIHAALQGWDLRASARFAAAVAAHTLAGMGGTQTAPTLARVMKSLES